MGKRITIIFTILISMTLFSLFAAMVTTTQTNDAIIEHTEAFVEQVRYKGCITENAYYEFLDGFDVPVDVRFTITRKPALAAAGAGDTIEFTGDVIKAFTTDADSDGALDKMYRMNIGDEISVVVRKPSGNYFDSLVGLLTGERSPGTNPTIAVKGGMILNAQYQGA